MITWFS